MMLLTGNVGKSPARPTAGRPRWAAVGVYAVGTVPAYRRRGLATVLMRHVLADAYRSGARTASLQSTPIGRALYESLGFRAVGRYEEWAWTGR